MQQAALALTLLAAAVFSVDGQLGGFGNLPTRHLGRSLNFGNQGGFGGFGNQGFGNAGSFGPGPSFGSFGGGFGGARFGGFGGDRFGGHGGYGGPGFGDGFAMDRALTFNPANPNVRWETREMPAAEAPKQLVKESKELKEEDASMEVVESPAVITSQTAKPGAYANWQAVQCKNGKCEYTNSEKPGEALISDGHVNPNAFYNPQMSQRMAQSQHVPQVPVRAPPVQAPPMMVPQMPTLKSSKWTSWLQPSIMQQQPTSADLRHVRQVKKLGPVADRCNDNHGRVDDHCFAVGGAILRYRYSVVAGKCAQFYGCTPTARGSKNNFSSKEECDNECRRL